MLQNIIYVIFPTLNICAAHKYRLYPYPSIVTKYVITNLPISTFFITSFCYVLISITMKCIFHQIRYLYGIIFLYMSYLLRYFNMLLKNGNNINFVVDLVCLNITNLICYLLRQFIAQITFSDFPSILENN